MKRYIVFLVILVLASVFSVQAAQTIIQSGPGGDGSQWNNGVNDLAPLTGNVVLAPPHSGWSPAVGTSQWISFLNNFSPTPNGQDACSHTISTPICNGEWVTFYHDFTLLGSGNKGTLYVMADDTADVSINGNLLFAASGPVGSGDTYGHCSDYVVGCLNPQTIGIADLTPYLLAGNNELVFTVWQRNGTGFGLDYFASVPEPGFYGVLALGLSGLCCLAFRRKRSA